MSDRELLELAAKAAGCEVTPPAEDDGFGFDKCPDCGAAASCTLGADYRFNPPSYKPQMWTVRCSECFDLSMSWTAFTTERARRSWNEGARRRAAAIGKATP